MYKLILRKSKNYIQRPISESKSYLSIISPFILTFEDWKNFYFPFKLDFIERCLYTGVKSFRSLINYLTLKPRNSCIKFINDVIFNFYMLLMIDNDFLR